MSRPSSDAVNHPLSLPTGRLGVALLATVPATLLVLATIIHPPRLNLAGAETWRNLHFALLFVFPLVGLAPWIVARRAGRAYGWLAGILGYGFATAYAGLDLLAGVGGGALVISGNSDKTGPIFAMARILEQIGGISLVLGCAVAAVAAFRLVGWRALAGGVVAIVGAFLLGPMGFHIYPGRGTLATGVLTIGFALLAVAVTSGRRGTQPG